MKKARRHHSPSWFSQTVVLVQYGHGGFTADCIWLTVCVGCTVSVCVCVCVGGGGLVLFLIYYYFCGL